MIVSWIVSPTYGATLGVLNTTLAQALPSLDVVSPLLQYGIGGIFLAFVILQNYRLSTRNDEFFKIIQDSAKERIEESLKSADALAASGHAQREMAQAVQHSTANQAMLSQKVAELVLLLQHDKGNK